MHFKVQTQLFNNGSPIAPNLSAFAINLQSVATGHTEKAQTSIVKIDRQAATKNDTELDMIKARRKPMRSRRVRSSQLTRRDLLWSAFDQSVQLDIEKLAKEVYDLIFKPDLDLRSRPPIYP